MEFTGKIEAENDGFSVNIVFQFASKDKPVSEVRRFDDIATARAYLISEKLAYLTYCIDVFVQHKVILSKTGNYKDVSWHTALGKLIDFKNYVFRDHKPVVSSVAKATINMYKWLMQSLPHENNNSYKSSKECVEIMVKVSNELLEDIKQQ